jgi:hypothetical protein
LDTKPKKTKQHKMFDYSYHGLGGSVQAGGYAIQFDTMTYVRYFQ